jgi:unsaturated chondroitin disaccharide hydrolase
MKFLYYAVSALCFFLVGFLPGQQNKSFVKENIDYADAQMKNMLRSVVPEYNRFPRTTDSTGATVKTNEYEWTSGFFPGNLWYLYELTGNSQYKEAAQRWTENLEKVQFYTSHHDLGFIMYCSYGNGLRLTSNKAYQPVLIQAAKSLATRFNTNTGSIKSWDQFRSWHGDKVYHYPVIIDNMMNLELLFFASKVTGDPLYKKIAVTHANTTMKHQLKNDYGVYHVVCYDKNNGNVIAKETAQGLADNSTWARGQAWGIYGFTMTYRETGDPRYLETAEKMADFYLNHKSLPSDKVPLWDFNLGQKSYNAGKLSYAIVEQRKLRDASAAAITASALLELSQYSKENKERFKKAAVQILHSLSSSNYRAPLGKNGNFLLMHSVGSIPHRTEIDVPLVYADYYFLEALCRYQKLLGGQKLFTKLERN